MDWLGSGPGLSLDEQRWLVEHDPNPETTAAIQRIDLDIARTVEATHLLLARAVCLTCGQNGIHVHYLDAPSEVPHD